MEGLAHEQDNQAPDFLRFAVTVNTSALPEGFSVVGEDLRAALENSLGGLVTPTAIRVTQVENAQVASARPPVVRPHEGLSERELEVLNLLGEGASNAGIGRALSISESTVKGHVTRLLVKLGVQNRVQAALLHRDWSQNASNT